jgi:hypothetical protein
MAQQPLMGQVPLIMEASRSHSDTPHSVGLLWASDRPDNTQTSIPPAGFKPTMPASERPQTHASDSAATGNAVEMTYDNSDAIPTPLHRCENSIKIETAEMQFFLGKLHDTH